MLNKPMNTSIKHQGHGTSSNIKPCITHMEIKTVQFQNNYMTVSLTNWSLPLK